MKKIVDFFKNNWPAVLILIVTLFTWHKLLGQTLFGEGYYYFDRQQAFVGKNGRVNEIRTTDVFARIIFDILIPTLKDNLTYYLAFQLVVMAILNIIFFFVLYYETKEKWLSLIATLIFSVSYIGLFEMLGTGNYQRFVQRIPNLVFEFISFYFLIKYLRKRNLKNLIISYLVFALAVFLAHFSTFLLPLFLIYPVVLSFTQKNIIKSLLRNIAVSLPYLLLNFFIISQDPLEPKKGLLTFILQRKDLVEKIVLQFASLNIPPFVIDKISTVAQPFKNALIIITVPIIFIYILGFFLIKKNLPKLKVLYLTSLLVIPILLFLNLFLGKVDPEFDIAGFHYYFLPDYYIGKIDTFTSIKGDRYYLVPMFFVSIVWSSLFLAILKGKKNIYKIFTLVFLALYIAYNTTLIWDKFNRLKPLADEVKAYVAYVKSIKNEFKPNTTLVVPEYFMWPSTMIRVFYGYPDMQFLSLGRSWQKDIDPTHKNEVIIINYNYKTKTFTQSKYVKKL